MITVLSIMNINIRVFSNFHKQIKKIYVSVKIGQMENETVGACTLILFSIKYCLSNIHMKMLHLKRYVNMCSHLKEV